MKKILSAVMFVIFTGIFNFCSASYDYYENHPDYLGAYASHGEYCFLYCPSVSVQEYNPPHYQIAGTFIVGSAYDEKIEKEYIAIRYNWYTKETFRRENGTWKKDQIPTGNTGWDMIVRGKLQGTANALFRAAYRMNFYGY